MHFLSSELAWQTTDKICCMVVSSDAGSVLLGLSDRSIEVGVVRFASVIIGWLLSGLVVVTTE